MAGSINFRKFLPSNYTFTTGTIPAKLAPLFGPTRFTCTNAAAKLDLKNYGFAVLPAGTSPGDCGSAG